MDRIEAARSRLENNDVQRWGRSLVLGALYLGAVLEGIEQHLDYIATKLAEK